MLSPDSKMLTARTWLSPIHLMVAVPISWLVISDHEVAARHLGSAGFGPVPRSLLEDSQFTLDEVVRAAGDAGLPPDFVDPFPAAEPLSDDATEIQRAGEVDPDDSVGVGQVDVTRPDVVAADAAQGT